MPLTVTIEALLGLPSTEEVDFPSEDEAFDDWTTLLDDVGGRGGAGGVAMMGLTLRLTAGDSLTMDLGGTGTDEPAAPAGGCGGFLPGEEEGTTAPGRSSPLLRLCSTTWWYCLGKSGGGAFSSISVVLTVSFRPKAVSIAFLVGPRLEEEADKEERW